jgi:hypothetical protein
MPQDFVGSALPLDAAGMAEVIDRLGVKEAEIWAVLTVETRGCGFLPDRRPFILYEQHIFSRETNHKFDALYPDISNPTPGGYGAGGAHQYDRLSRGMDLDRRAALRSTSWGIGQVMGFNAETAGYQDVEGMVAAMTISETVQLLAMAGEIFHNNLDSALRGHDWADFAKGYNGTNFRKNNYDIRLSAAYEKYSSGPLPDLALRAAQTYLTYLGFHPGPVDGVMGRFTRSALQDFQAAHNLTVTDLIDEDLLSALKGEVEALST